MPTETTELIVAEEAGQGELVPPAPALSGGSLALPLLIHNAGPHAAKRFLEFFSVNIRNPNTREAYARAAVQFLTWCETHGVRDLRDVEPMVVAAFIEQQTKERAPQTVKQQLSGIRMLFDWLVIGQVLPHNPAHAVRGPKHSTKKGKTPVLTREDTRRLLDSIPIVRKDRSTGAEAACVIGLRDRALIGLMVYSFARVGAVLQMQVSDYYASGKRWWIKLHEKGGKFHEVPVHHTAEEYLDAYLDAAGIRSAPRSPLFQSSQGRKYILTDRPMSAVDALRMIKRRAETAGLPTSTCCHTFRATGITAYLENGGTIENAQAIAAHESPRTTKLYDRRGDNISLDEIEKIVI